jgi:hypothetical protein
MRYRWEDRKADLENPPNPWPLRIEVGLFAAMLVMVVVSIVARLL